jgi:hypothetical protein
MPVNVRDHQPFVIDRFGGLWQRGDVENTPLDHFSEANNLRYFGTNSFGSRFGVGPTQNVASPLANILRIYNYPTNTQQTLLILTTGGNIYHVVDATTVFGPVLTIPAMTDFGFVPYAGRAYITPFTTEVAGQLNIERGLSGQFLYVYKGDGTAARPAGGTAPSSVITVTNGIAGFTDAGVHIFGYVYETDTGYLTPPGGLVAFTTDGTHALDFTGVANSPDAFVVKKHIVASPVIQNFNGDVTGYDLFFIPGADINNNVTTSLSGISFFDQDLLDDATHLLDNFSQIPAGVGLSLYHNRLVSWAEHDNTFVARVSAVGEPEAISQITGLVSVPPDGNPLTNGFELRDVLYLTKRNKTYSFVDNGDDPTTWQLTTVDNGMGTGVHGVGTNLDSGSANIDYVIIGTYKGITLFNGTYTIPELSWKIQDFWMQQDFANNFRKIQILNDSVAQNIYLVTTDRNMLYANYMNGLDPKNIRWCPWSFKTFVNTIALFNINELILGVDQL